MGGKLLGIVTNRDTDFLADRDAKLGAIMTTALVVATDRMSLDQANAVLMESKRAKLPVVNGRYELTALMSRTDLHKNRYDISFYMLLPEKLSDCFIQ